MKYDDMREEAEERYRKKQEEMKFNEEQRKILRFNVSELKPELLETGNLNDQTEIHL